ncbi:MAG: hypothetical protein [Microviridae sp.]|nr:MAG: hypothetical protein [Microviridae sp.]
MSSEFLDPSVVRVYYEIGASYASYVTTIQELMYMAEKDSRTVELTLMQRLWVQKALELQVASLKRSLTKEPVGSEIHRLRSKEIVDLSACIHLFS